VVLQGGVTPTERNWLGIKGIDTAGPVPELGERCSNGGRDNLTKGESSKRRREKEGENNWLETVTTKEEINSSDGRI